MSSKRVALFAAGVLLLGGACSSEPDQDRVGDPGPDATTASGSEGPSPVRLAVLGDSNASPTACFGCTIFPEQVAEALVDALGREVEVANFAWELSNPSPAQVDDIVSLVRADDVPRDVVAEADAVLILVSQNDLAYNRIDDPCGVAPRYPRIRWRELTRTCIDASVRDYERHLEALLDEIDALRAGRPTMLRIVTAFNTTIGDLVDPTWNSPDAVGPSTYNVERMAAVQCRLARLHGGLCADALQALNGDGRKSAQPFLNPADATHLAQRGHDRVAEVLIDLGFEPLVAGR